MMVKRTLGIVSISDKKSYNKICQSFEAGPAEMHPVVANDYIHIYSCNFPES